MQYLRIYETINGGYVDLHPLHGADELSANSVAAIAIADLGHCIQLLPSIATADHEARLEWLPDVPGNKNPDVRIDGNLIGDIKTPNLYIPVKQSTINRCIYACAQQKVSVAIINLLKRDYTIQDIKKGIIGALQPNRNKTIQQVWVITANGNIFKAHRTSVFDETIYEMLKLL